MTLLTVRQVAAEMNEHPRTTLDRMHRGEFGTPINLGSNKQGGARWRIDRRGVDLFVESRRIAA